MHKLTGVFNINQLPFINKYYLHGNLDEAQKCCDQGCFIVKLTVDHSHYIQCYEQPLELCHEAVLLI